MSILTRFNPPLRKRVSLSLRTMTSRVAPAFMTDATSMIAVPIMKEMIGLRSCSTVGRSEVSVGVGVGLLVEDGAVEVEDMQLVDTLVV